MTYDVTTQENYLTLEDGERIFYRMYIPQSKAAKTGAVILSHGYNSCSEHLHDVAEAFAKRGLLSCCYDFRGGSVNSKSSGSSLDMSVCSELNDLFAVADMIRKLDMLDGEKLYLYGESQGGFVSALAAAEKPSMFAGAMLLYPAFCIPDDWRNRGISDGETFEIMGMKLSDSYVKGLPQYDVFEKIKDFGGEVVIGHGTADRVVPYDYSVRARDSFKNAKLIAFENEGHGFSGEARRKWINCCIDVF